MQRGRSNGRHGSPAYRLRAVPIPAPAVPVSGFGGGGGGGGGPVVSGGQGRSVNQPGLTANLSAGSGFTGDTALGGRWGGRFFGPSGGGALPTGVAGWFRAWSPRTTGPALRSCTDPSAQRGNGGGRDRPMRRTRLNCRMPNPSCPDLFGASRIFTTETRRSGGEVSIPVLLTVSPSLWFKDWKRGWPAYAVRKSASAD